MATTQEIQWETETTPSTQSAAKSSIIKPYAFSSSLRGDPTSPKKSIWEKSPFSSFTTTNDHPTAADEVVPSSRKFSKRNRIILGVAIVLLLVLIIGLAAGLTRNGSKSAAKNLPLPSNTATFNGDITFYNPGPGYGACGFENTSTDSICAVSHIIFDATMVDGNPNHNPICGEKIRITRYNGSRNHSMDVTVVDRCVGCVAEDLDLSIKVFTALADEAQGRTKASWAWLN